jgi:hypothetical protein
MLTKPVTRNGPAVTKNGRPVLVSSPATREDEALRRHARKQLERISNFKLSLGIFLVGMPLLTALWALTEYMNADGWPERFSESAGPGNWNPWILWVLLIWGGLVAIQGVRAYFGRPPTEADIDREIARLKARASS